MAGSVRACLDHRHADGHNLDCDDPEELECALDATLICIVDYTQTVTVAIGHNTMLWISRRYTGRVQAGDANGG
jgi:hypothetical protein